MAFVPARASTSGTLPYGDSEDWSGAPDFSFEVY